MRNRPSLKGNTGSFIGNNRTNQNRVNVYTVFPQQTGMDRTDRPNDFITWSIINVVISFLMCSFRYK